jgi:hypothetical protein
MRIVNVFLRSMIDEEDDKAVIGLEVKGAQSPGLSPATAF